MNNKRDCIVIAIDVMGGDKAPHSVIEGISCFLSSDNYTGKVEFLLFGQEDRINELLPKYPSIKKFCKIIHCNDIILPEDKPSSAIRRGKESSMKKAVESVKNGDADVVISAGNTGALMAFSKLILGSLDFIDRPAIASLIPTLTGKTVLLDLGANATCDANNLFQFALMGDAFAKNLLKIKSPKVALLNIGSEAGKGNEVINIASQMLSEKGSPVNFYGFVEGNDIAEGVVDVIVTDGFTGNVALKTAEGTAKVAKHFLSEAFRSSIFAMIGYMLAGSSIKKLLKKLDPRFYNGAMFLGLNGIAIKSHGNVDGIGFSNAIKTGYELAYNDINKQIIEEINLLSYRDENKDDNDTDSDKKNDVDN